MSLAHKVPAVSDRYANMEQFRAREAWHVLKVMAEFVESAEELQSVLPAVSIFGSARTPPDHAYISWQNRLPDACQIRGLPSSQAEAPV